jgi:hypothetical protein
MDKYIICKNTGNNIVVSDEFFSKLRVWIAYSKFFDFGVRYERMLALKNINIPLPEKEKLEYDFNSKIDKMIDSGLITEEFLGFCMQSEESGTVNCEVCEEILNAIERKDFEIHYDNQVDLIQKFKLILEECIQNNSDLRWC